MEVKEAVKTRRSIRKYLDKNVDDSTVIELLDAARFAPSCGNVQNWKFIIVRDKEKRKRLAECCLNQSWMADAPVFIVVCNDLRAIGRMFKKRGEELYSTQNVASAVQNILLTATSLGLGSCWVGAFDEYAVSKAVVIPDGIRPEAIVTIGYSFDKIFEVPHRHELNELCFLESWGKDRKSFGIFPVEEKVGVVGEKTKGVLEKIKDKFYSLKDFIKNKLKKGDKTDSEEVP